MGASPQSSLCDGRSLPCSACADCPTRDRKSTRLNSSHRCISYAVFCLKKKNRLVFAKRLCQYPIRGPPISRISWQSFIAFLYVENASIADIHVHFRLC